MRFTLSQAKVEVDFRFTLVLGARSIFWKWKWVFWFTLTLSALFLQNQLFCAKLLGAHLHLRHSIRCLALLVEWPKSCANSLCVPPYSRNWLTGSEHTEVYYSLLRNITLEYIIAYVWLTKIKSEPNQDDIPDKKLRSLSQGVLKLAGIINDLIKVIKINHFSSL